MDIRVVKTANTGRDHQECVNGASEAVTGDYTLYAPNGIGRRIYNGIMNTVEDNLQHEVSELICLKCLSRWIGVYPVDTPLKQLECKCGEVGYVIKTGQTITTDIKLCDKCAYQSKGKCKLRLSYNADIYCEYFKSLFSQQKSRFSQGFSQRGTRI